MNMGFVIRCLTCVPLAIAIVGCETTPHQTQQALAEQRWQQVRGEVKYQLAMQQREKGRVDDAISSLTEAVTLSPEDAVYRTTLATWLLESGQIPEATRQLQTAETLGASSAAYHYASGLLAERRGAGEEAVGHFEAAFAGERSNIDHLTALVESLVTVGRPAEARSLVDEHLNDFDRAVKLLVIRATIAELQGDDAQADRDYTEARARCEDASWLDERHALLWVRTGAYAKAMPVLKTLVSSQRTNDIGSSAVPDGRGGSDVVSSAQWVRALATCHNRTGTPDQARRLLYDHLESTPTDGRAWWLLAEAHVRLGEWHAAQRCVDRGRQIASDRPEWALLQAYLIARTEGSAEASEYATRVADEHPDFEPAQFMLQALTGNVRDVPASR